MHVATIKKNYLHKFKVSRVTEYPITYNFFKKILYISKNAFYVVFGVLLQNVVQ